MRSGTSSTQPCAPGFPAETICQMCPPPCARRALSSLRRYDESTNAHPPPRISSSEKSVMHHFSGIFSGVTIARPWPRYSALGCTVDEMSSTVSPSARRMRSTTAIARTAQPGETPLCASCSISAQSRTHAFISLASELTLLSSTILPEPGLAVMPRFSAASAIQRARARVSLSMPSEPSFIAPRERSAMRRSWASRPRSR
mmetsp:Transcript_14388/g.34837  ORF Transcript_14388/g.34837 Transcript_14388/m.34837 type:complete len:201 (+) Transcript_14388:1490-2092(+)